MGTSCWHCQGLEEAKSAAFTFIDHVLVFQVNQPRASRGSSQIYHSGDALCQTQYFSVAGVGDREGIVRLPNRAMLAQDEICLLSRRKICCSVQVNKSTLRSADEKPGPHSLVTAVLLKWVVMRTVRFNRNVIYSYVLFLFSPSLLVARGSLSFCKEVSGKAASLAD